MLQNYVYTLLIRAIKRQESNHSIIINLEEVSEDISRKMQEVTPQPQPSQPPTSQAELLTEESSQEMGWLQWKHEDRTLH